MLLTVNAESTLLVMEYCREIIILINLIDLKRVAFHD